MDLQQLNAVLDRHDRRETTAGATLSRFDDAGGPVRALEPQTLKSRDDYREPRRSYDDLFDTSD